VSNRTVWKNGVFSICRRISSRCPAVSAANRAARPFVWRRFRSLTALIYVFFRPLLNRALVNEIDRASLMRAGVAIHRRQDAGDRIDYGRLIGGQRGKRSRVIGRLTAAVASASCTAPDPPLPRRRRPRRPRAGSSPAVRRSTNDRRLSPLLGRDAAVGPNGIL
jgi:hypothetical protein